MNKCLDCGHEHNGRTIKCPKCGKFYSKIIEIIDEYEAEEELQTLRGRCKRIFKADNAKDALFSEFKLIKAGLTKKGWLALIVIFVFVFALVVSVL